MHVASCWIYSVDRGNALIQMNKIEIANFLLFSLNRFKKNWIFNSDTQLLGQHTHQQCDTEQQTTVSKSLNQNFWFQVFKCSTKSTRFIQPATSCKSEEVFAHYSLYYYGFGGDLYTFPQCSMGECRQFRCSKMWTPNGAGISSNPSPKTISNNFEQFSPI